MSTELRQARHAVTGAAVWEVWQDGAMVAAVYPHAAGGIHVVTKHRLSVLHQQVPPLPLDEVIITIHTGPTS